MQSCQLKLYCHSIGFDGNFIITSETYMKVLLAKETFSNTFKLSYGKGNTYPGIKY